MSESELMNSADGSLLDISLEEELCTSERFSCGICEASYARKAYLNRHLKTHEDGCIKCSVCTQFFKTEEDKRKHIEDKHRPIMCESCGKVFSTRNYMEFHKKTHEVEVVNYDKKCPFPNCGKIYWQNSKFQDHLMMRFK
ncbi:transcription factor IIIA-like [Dreissena polymorpha]|uniref:C2H2-type domain-containing protein n=1 Tax=Dreissena polymorpha TaxID=45954 RepID=A0A9D4FH31_DREPO|nr:transcription factor IIIA-like [Dreissena polymorpha]KAH3795707.1 hypothetical protein DPMN_149264 [Dreissena polymorpha]